MDPVEANAKVDPSRDCSTAPPHNGASKPVSGKRRASGKLNTKQGLVASKASMFEKSPEKRVNNLNGKPKHLQSIDTSNGKAECSNDKATASPRPDTLSPTKVSPSSGNEVIEKPQQKTAPVLTNTSSVALQQSSSSENKSDKDAHKKLKPGKFVSHQLTPQEPKQKDKHQHNDNPSKPASQPVKAQQNNKQLSNKQLEPRTSCYTLKGPDIVDVRPGITYTLPRPHVSVRITSSKTEGSQVLSNQQKPIVIQIGQNNK